MHFSFKFILRVPSVTNSFEISCLKESQLKLEGRTNCTLDFIFITNFTIDRTHCTGNLLQAKQTQWIEISVNCFRLGQTELSFLFQSINLKGILLKN